MNSFNLEKRLSVDIYSSFDEIEYLRKNWDEFIEFVGGDIYLSFDWCRIWWEFYGTGRKLHLFIYKYGGDIIGLLPLFYEQQWIGLAWLKVAKFVGSDFTTSMIHLPVNKYFSAKIFKDIIDTTLKKHACDALWLGPVREENEELQQLRATILQTTGVTLLKDNAFSLYTAFLLPGSFNEYTQSLDKRQRGNLRRDLNLINKSFHVTQDIISDATLAKEEFDEFIRMHAEQWQAEGKLGHFCDWPNGVEFNSTLVSEMARRGRLRLVRLLFDGNVVSYQYCFAFGRRWYWRLPARAVGPSWNKFALGRVGLAKEIELAIAEGIEEIEAGVGHYDYKVKLGGKEYPLYTFLIVRNGLFRYLRACFFIKFSKAIHLIYYRIWFNRLAPKLPFNRSALCKLWIRTRI